ncbi:MAG: hypothetical protein WCP20_11795 [Desulfuromonadales bacterium]
MILCAALVFALRPATAADYALVAHKGVQVNSLTKDEVRSIFLGDMTRWNDGKAIKFAT